MIRVIGKYILTFIITMGILISLLFLSSLIPSNKIENNVRKSSEILMQDGEKKLVDTYFRQDCIFYFTDALMINTAYSIDSTNPYSSMLLARKNYVPGKTQNFHEEIQMHIGTSPKYTDKYYNTFQVAELYGLMHGDDIVDSYEYTRYWHGYLIFLRPLLAIMDLGAIRILTIALTGIFSIIIVWLIIKKLNLITAIIYIIGFILFDLFIVCNSMNEITTFMIALVAMIFILLRNGKFKNPALVFLCIGMCTSFLDLLTTPLITIGLTLPIYVLLNFKESNKKLYIECIKICIAWAVGYGLCWALKWVITDLTLHKHIISDAIKQIMYRTTADRTLLEVVIKNLNEIGRNVIIIFIGLLVIYSIIGLIKEFYISKVKNEKTPKIELLKVMIFLIIAMFPFIWYFIIRNHSFVHSFFTNRNYIITVINIQIALTIYMGFQNNLINKEDKKLIEEPKNKNL